MRMLVDIFAQIFRTLWAHKLRSFLTMFGIAWESGLCCCWWGWRRFSFGQPKREMEQYGKDIMFIFPGRAPWSKANMSSARNYFAHLSGLSGHTQGSAACAQCFARAGPAGCASVSEFAHANGRNCRSRAAVQ